MLGVGANIGAINAHRQLTGTDRALGQTLEKLSSGKRVNRASDDAAGLSISESLQTQVRGTSQAARNVQDAISLLNTAEGALQSMQDILHRARELAVQASNGTLTDADRDAVQLEVDQLMAGIYDMSQNTLFNSMPILGVPQSLVFQVGANEGQTVAFDIPQVDQVTLGISALLVTPQDQAMLAIQDIDYAVSDLLAVRTNIGAMHNRLEHTVNSLYVSAENQGAAESRIRDADMAESMTHFTRQQILHQSATAMLSQANGSQQTILSLLRGT